MDALELSTNDDLVDAILRFAELRKRRSQLTAAGDYAQHLRRKPVTFLWPEMLWLLLAVPALVAAYIFLLGRKKKSALRYGSLSLVKEAMDSGQRLRRHIPPLLFLIAITALILAVARPAASSCCRLTN